MMCLATPEFIAFCAKVWEEVQAADSKYGDWSGVDIVECSGNVISEAYEIADAADAQDIDGDHGIKRESVQTAATAFKMHRRVS